MSDGDKPDKQIRRVEGKPASRTTHGAGRSGSARSIGQELGELDFEPDDLLDALLGDTPSPTEGEDPPTVRLEPSGLDLADVTDDPGDAPPASGTSLEFDPSVAPPGLEEPTAWPSADDVEDLVTDEIEELSQTPPPPEAKDQFEDLSDMQFEEVVDSVRAAAVQIEELSDLQFEEVLDSARPPGDGQEPMGFEELLDSVRPASSPLAEGVTEHGYTELSAEELLALEREDTEDVPDHEIVDERPALDHLEERGLADAFRGKAERFEQQARATADGHAKSRALLVASELWALLGESERALTAAQEAHAAHTAAAMPSRQQRWLSMQKGDFKAVVTTLEFETRAAPSPESRVHAALLSASVHRHKLDDTAAARRKLDLAMRAMPDDVRAYLGKLPDSLDGSPQSRLRWPEIEGFQSLANAYDQMLALRSASAPATHPVAILLKARKLLTLRSTPALISELDKLAEISDFKVPSLWLSASLLAPMRTTRTRSIDALRELMAIAPSPLVERTLARRALEQSDSATVQEVVARGNLPPLDRLVLLALAGGWLDEHRSLLTGDVEPELAALRAALGSVSGVMGPYAGDDKAQACVDAARILARLSHENSAELQQALDKVSGLQERESLSRALALAFALASNESEALAHAIAQWPAAAEETFAERDRTLVSALIRELAGNADAASGDYAAVFALDPEFEAALRAVATQRGREQKASLLEELADGLEPGPRKAVTLLEAAHYVAPHDKDRSKRLLEASRDAEPTLPFADWLAERFALQSQDHAELVRVIQRARSATEDPALLALSQLREARLVASAQPERARELLAKASEAFPGDAAVREWLEELAEAASDADSGGWREDLAAATSGRDQAELLVQASLAHLFADDLTAAIHTGMSAAMLDHGQLGDVIAERAVWYGGDADELRRALTQQLETSDAAAQLAATRQLARLESRHGDAEAIILAHHRVLELDPTSFDSLRALEHALISEARIEELEPVATALSQVLGPAEGAAHAWLATRIRMDAGDWSRCRELCEPLTGLAVPPMWSLRLLASQAETEKDWPVALTMYSRLSQMATRPADRATLALRAATAASELDQLTQARELLDRASEGIPDHLPLAQARSRLLDRLGDHRAAAEAYELVAELSHVESHKLQALSRAGTLWLDHVGDPQRALGALELAAQIDPTSDAVFQRLHDLYLGSGQSEKLAVIIEHRLDRTEDPQERIQLEVTRARALSAIGDTAAAKDALSRALAADPEHLDALDAFAEVCARSGDHAQAEQAWIRLSRQATDSDRQAELYMKLGDLYESSLPNPERAEVAYNEVLKRRPSDPRASAKLVRVFARMGRENEAIALQDKLISDAPDDEHKRAHTLALASLHEEVLQDRKKAETTLERARRQWPHAPDVLRAVATFHERAGDARSRATVISRAAHEARRALNTGRFDVSFFEMLKATAELEENPPLARSIDSTMAALAGRREPLQGAGARASDPALDDLLAPEVLSPQFRALLQHTGDFLDVAYALDTKSLRATPFPPEAEDFDAQIQQIAPAFGLNQVEAFMSPMIGPVCLPLSSSPPVLVFGKALLESDDEAAKMFLLFRTLKILQSRTATLARAAPIELAPLVSGLLRALVPTWEPQGVDAKKLALAQQKLEGVRAFHIDEHARRLATEVTESLGTRVSQLGAAAQHWGSRTALLASGDLHTGFRAFALMTEHAHGLPEAGADRLKWVVRNSDARDLSVFSVSEAYAQARNQLGIGG